MELPDFTNLPLASVVATLLFFATIDTLVSYGVALVNKNFSADYALDFLRSHILKVGVPILGLAVVGHGVESIGIPAIPAAGVMATGSLAIYAIATIASIRDSFSDKAIAPA